MARLSSATPPSSRSRRCKTAPSCPESSATPSRPRSISDIGCASSETFAPSFRGRAQQGTRNDERGDPARLSSEHLDQAMQRLGGDLFVLHHGDADVVFARIAAVGLLAGEIAAGYDAQPGLAPQRDRCGLAAALRRHVEPEKEAAGRPAITVTVADDLIGEVEFLPVQL